MTNLMELTIPNPDSALFDRAQGHLAAAREVRITTPAMLDAAGESLQVIKGLQKDLEAKRTTITGPLNNALKRVNDLFRPAKTWLEEAETLTKNGMLGYRREQEEKAREEQRKLDEAAAKERAKLAAQAAEAERKAREKADAARREAEERDRLALEARRKAEAEAQAATDATERAAAQERAAAARLAQEASDRESAKQRAKAAEQEAAAQAKADGLREQAASVQAPKVVADLQKTAGQAVREVWTWEATDLMAIPDEYWILDTKRVDGVVRALKDRANIPGVKVRRGESIASRSV